MLQVDGLDPTRTVALAMRESVASTNVFVHVEATRAAAGIGLLPAFMADRHDDLVRVLPEYEFEPSAVFAVYPSARQLSTKTRAAVDFLAAKLTDPPTWDQRLRGKVAGF